MHRFIAAFLLTLALPVRAGETQLYVLNWSDYIDPETIADFERETGISVVYDTYQNGEATEARLHTRNSGYDVVVVASEYISRLAEDGAIAALDRARLPNAADILPDVAREMARLDPEPSHGIPYLWGTTGIAYDANAVAERMPDAPLESWAMLFDPTVVGRFADCGVGLLDAPEEVLAGALIYLGLDPNTRDRGEIAAGLRAIQRVAPYVSRFHSAQISLLADKELCLSLAWSGDLLAAAERQAEGLDLRYSLPSEGALIWFDLMVVPGDARHGEAAYQFIDFMLRPDIAARNSNETLYANASAPAQGLVDPALLSDPASYPPPAVMGRLVSVTGRTAAEKRLIARAFTRLKLGLDLGPEFEGD